MTRSDMKQFIEGLKKVQETLTATQAAEVVGIFTKLRGAGGLVKAGTRILFDGQIYRVAVDTWDREEFNPATAPTLYVAINYTNNIRHIPEVFQASDAFSLGERGMWKGKIYESTININVYTPDDYPAGWKLIEEE